MTKKQMTKKQIRRFLINDYLGISSFSGIIPTITETKKFVRKQEAGCKEWLKTHNDLCDRQHI